MSPNGRIRMPARTVVAMVWNYARVRLFAQVKSVAFIVCYLLLFQLLIVGVTPTQAVEIAVGVGLVVLGLACFLEGLILGLMPLGEQLGLQLPRRGGVLLRIGRQTHAASVEQIIAALDELKGGTVWRKRYEEPRARRDGAAASRRALQEISFVCAEGGAPDLVRAAMEAGAGGATFSRARSLGDAEGGDGGAARECGSLCVSAEKADGVVAALARAAERAGDTACRIQTQEILSVFSHAGIGVRV